MSRRLLIYDVEVLINQGVVIRSGIIPRVDVERVRRSSVFVIVDHCWRQNCKYLQIGQPMLFEMQARWWSRPRYVCNTTYTRCYGVASVTVLNNKRHTIKMVQWHTGWYSDTQDGTVTHMMVQWHTRWYSDTPDGTVTHRMVQWHTGWYSDTQDGTVTHRMVQWHTRYHSDTPDAIQCNTTVLPTMRHACSNVVDV